MRRIRECRNDLADSVMLKTWPGTKWFLEHWIKEHQAEAEKLTKQLNWLKNPSKNTGLDLARAKAVPITHLLEIKRKLARCPWHEDRNASLHYYEKQNKVHCFVCNNGGDVVDIAQAIWGVDFKEAVKRLCQ